MIELADLAFESNPLGKTWNISHFFRDSEARIVLRERESSTQFAKVPASKVDLGSLRHTRSYSGAFSIEAVSKSRCGIDIEIPEILENEWNMDSKSFDVAILAEGERDKILSSKYASDLNLPTVIWSSKEALAKALGDATRYEPNKLESPIVWANLQHGRWQAVHVDFRTPDQKRLIVWFVYESGSN